MSWALILKSLEGVGRFLAPHWKKLLGGFFLWREGRRQVKDEIRKEEIKHLDAVVKEHERHAEIDSRPVNSDSAYAGLRKFGQKRATGSDGESSVPRSKRKHD